MVVWVEFFFGFQAFGGSSLDILGVFFPGSGDFLSRSFFV